MSSDDQLFALTAPPVVPDPVERVMGRVRRNRRRRALGAIAAVAAAVVALPLLLAEVRSPSRPVPAAPVVVPWDLRLAEPAVNPSPGPRVTADLPVCDLASISLGRAVPAEDGRGVRVAITLTTTGERCWIRSDQLAAVITTEDGAPVTTRPAKGWYGDFAPLAVLGAGDQAGVTLQWTSWCGADPGRWRVQLRLHSKTHDSSAAGQVAPGSAAPGCGDPQGLAVMSAVSALNAYGQPREDPQAVLETSLTGGDKAPLGGVAHLRLTLSNPSRGPVPLTPCPTLGIAVTRPGTPAGGLTPPLALNCPGAPADVAAGGQVTFLVEVPLTPAIADGHLVPGPWDVWAWLVGRTEHSVRVQIGPEAEEAGAAVDCSYAADPEAPGQALPADEVTLASLPTHGTLVTEAGDLPIAFDPRSPCAVNAVLDQARRGLWDHVPLRRSGRALSGTRGSTYVWPTEVRPGTTYPAGTVLLVPDGALVSGRELQIAVGALSYPPEFVPLGRLTSAVPGADRIVVSGIRAD